MSRPVATESVRRALRRARWLHWALVLLILILALGTLQNGGKLQALRRRDAESRRVLLLGEARQLREKTPPGWLEQARAGLNTARHIQAGHDLRNEWIACLARAANQQDGKPVPCRLLPLPVGVRRGNPLSFDFTGDSSRLVAISEGRIVNWLIREPREAPRFFLGPRPPDPIFTKSLCATNGLRARVGDGGRVELLDVGGGPVAELQPPTERRAANLAWSDNGEWLAVAGVATAAAGPEIRTVELWHLPTLRQGLAQLELDWSDAAPAAPLQTPPEPDRWLRATRVSLGALLVFLVGTAAIANQHLVFRRYEQAERLAAERMAELEQIRDRMAHADKMRALGTLAAGVAHDFNNLLSVIQMSRQLVERSVKPTGVTQEQLDNIAQAVEQGRNVVRSILGYSRDTIVMTRRVRVGELLEETLTLLRGQFLGGLEVVQELAPELPAMEVSRGRLEQILLNLIVNAAEAMGGVGRLRLGARLVTDPAGCLRPPKGDGPWVELSVADNGPGIPPEVLPRIFEPFFTTKNLGNQRGTGLGLATVWRIAEEENFGLRVHTRPGTGTEFQLMVPLAKAPAAA